MEGKRDEIRKGPWKAEEDEVLINHVKKYGARDWSSIRAKGLLQRTGKSCRLRWVNKLRPNLKNGCKFSVEEERVVIELQAQFGNKWAKIATYLPGRTDNDVKNFWSSRQKRLARILQTSATPSSSSSSNSKPRKVKKEVPAFHDVPTLQEESSTKAQSCSSSYIDTPEPASIVPLPFHSDLVVKNELPCYDANLAQVETQTQIPFPQISQHQPELTFSPESQELLARLEDPFLFNVFGAVDAPELGAQLSLGPPLFDPFSSCLNGAREVRSPTTRGTFFDDFPSDVFDNIEPLPSP
ncbi:transcription factor DUO1-like isoform X2 [Hevea brasiliensis]|uniref:transcription factor DUO1 isoform X2 n=1 Tax=Hevea brasiliensis TaxID=3981 RepID=UPI0025CCAB6B|nr:transcription factor DUO1 isoform X2 [Hevea brasiliensis]XP_057998953.1 transcription factor DUO1-like isoform X2 [Hevea brasiliensis]